MLSDIFEEDKISNPKKKKKPELSKSDSFGDNITSLSSDADVSDYLVDFYNILKELYLLLEMII